MRCEVAEKGLQEAQGLKSEEALAKWEDVSSIRSNLLAAENKITSLLDDQDQLISAKNDLTGKLLLILKQKYFNTNNNVAISIHSSSVETYAFRKVGYPQQGGRDIVSISTWFLYTWFPYCAYVYLNTHIFLLGRETN
jgi:hypothetical protein